MEARVRRPMHRALTHALARRTSSVAALDEREVAVSVAVDFGVFDPPGSFGSDEEMGNGQTSAADVPGRRDVL